MSNRWRKRTIEDHYRAQRDGLVRAEARGHLFRTPRRWNETVRCINEGCHGIVLAGIVGDKGRIGAFGNALEDDCPAPRPAPPWEQQP